MWDLIRAMFSVGGEPNTKLDQRLSRGLERTRWLIYGVILLGVVGLAVAGVLLLLVP